MQANGEKPHRWAGRVWPDYDWARAELEHGAYHEVLLLPRGPVARLTDGLGHEHRMRRETEVMSLLAHLPTPLPVPRPLSPPVSEGGRSGVLISRVDGRSREGAPWPLVRAGLTRALVALRGAPEIETARRLPPPRHWCGGQAWPEVVAELLVPRLPRTARDTAKRVVSDVLEIEQQARPELVHGDFGLHNVLWTRSEVTGLIDVDHASWADPAIDVAPLIGSFSAGELRDDFCSELLQRAMYHRATLPLQIAASAELAGRAALREHALENFVRRLTAGTLYDPGQDRPRARP